MSLLPTRAWLAIAGVALVLGFFGWLRHDASRDARNQMAAEASRTQERIRTNADAAGRAAERDGAAGRLRDGTF